MLSRRLGGEKQEASVYVDSTLAELGSLLQRGSKLLHGCCLS